LARPALLRDLGGWAGSFTLLPLLAYLVTWTGWFATSTGYDRNWAEAHGTNIPVISPLISLFEYNKAMLAVHTGPQEHNPPPSQSTACSRRPPRRRGFVSGRRPGGGRGGGRGGAAAGVRPTAPPPLGGGATAALGGGRGGWWPRRDWRAGAVLVGVAAGW